MKNVPVFVPVFFYAVTMLIFQFKRTILSEKWFNYVVFFCFENTKNLGRLDDAKRKKKRGWPNSLLESLIKNELKLGTFTDKKLVLMKPTVLIFCTK